jgi:3-oxoadipate enol-lactonase
MSIAYEVHGDGEPLLLIMGLSGAGRAWYRLVPHLKGRVKAITFDNRGTGSSPPVLRPLSMRSMAADAVSVLDALGIESAHVMGVSMGGMIAQHLALDHRDRVRSLVLGCTTVRGRRGVPPARLMAATALRPFAGAGRTFALAAPLLYAERTRRERPERIAEDVRVRGADATGIRTTLAQMDAISRHDARRRLAELEGLDVTVIHGRDDALVPPALGEEVAAAIPGASLVMIPECGHMLTTDAEDAVAAAVHAHLDRAAGQSSSAA